jgi:hypothetical protein
VDREEDAEAAAGTDGALDLDPAAMLGHDPVAQAQSQAGPASDRLGREEEIEDLWE